MAANRFASIVHRNTNRLSLVLVYAVLEWTLIGLLFFHAVFSYAISRFVLFFGLKPPAFLYHDHPPEKVTPNFDHVDADDESLVVEQRGGFEEKFPSLEEKDRKSEIGTLQDDDGDDEEEEEDDDEDDSDNEEEESDEESESESESEEKSVANNDEVGTIQRTSSDKKVHRGNAFYRIMYQCQDCDSVVQERVFRVKDGEEGRGRGEEVDFFLESGDGGSPRYVVEIEDRLFSFGINDALNLRKSSGDLRKLRTVSPEKYPVASNGITGNQKGNQVLEEISRQFSEDSVGVVGVDRESSNHSLRDHEAAGKISDEEITQSVMDKVWEEIHENRVDVDVDAEKRSQESVVTKVGQQGSADHPQHQDPISHYKPEDISNETEDEAQVFEEGYKTEGEVSIGSKICDQEQLDLSGQNSPVSQVPFKEFNNGTKGKTHVFEEDSQLNGEISLASQLREAKYVDHSCHEETPSLDMGHVRSVDANVEDEIHASETRELEVMDHGTGFSIPVSPKHVEMEEERSTDAHNVDFVPDMSKRFTVDRKESVAESFDGSVVSDADSIETLTVDHLKAALKAERKALSALYTELEEERNASAIAADETMAMITRIQEEKAAMQMEALHYQRMMEEQADNDQEALHILDELAKRREKEKEELAKELEIYRNKVLLYEARERKRRKLEDANQNGGSGASSDDDEGHRPGCDLNEGDGARLTTHTDTALSAGQEQAAKKDLNTLTEWLADFEEDRVFILEQQNELQQRLSALDENGDPSQKVKDETEVDGVNQSEDSASKSALKMEQYKIMEEMDQLNQRLQALETDKTLLNNCIGALKEGSNEIDILHEILLHLRNVRNAETEDMNVESFD